MNISKFDKRKVKMMLLLLLFDRMLVEFAYMHAYREVCNSPVQIV